MGGRVRAICHWAFALQCNKNGLRPSCFCHPLKAGYKWRRHSCGRSGQWFSCSRLHLVPHPGHRAVHPQMHFQQLAFWRAISTSILRSTVSSVCRMFARYRCNSTLANCTNCCKLFRGQSASAGNEGKQEQSTLATASSANSSQASRNCCDNLFIVMSEDASRAPEANKSRKRVSARRKQVPKLFLSSWQYWSTSPVLKVSHSL
mmetsp:Transcript_133872/g.334208  ORF Transcript_133872/g.334208 Transcript_133872/m.334208 type:complete len:204 (+) Transcript_133872:525-1136(+)